MANDNRLISVGSFAAKTAVMGPGRRACLWVAGCDRNCPHCATPEYHRADANPLSDVQAIFDRVLRAKDKYGLEGFSISGGEPFAQAPALAELCRLIRPLGLSTLCWTGYRESELRGSAAPPGAADLLAELDVLIDGPFVYEQVCGDLPLRGSGNQRLRLLTDRYCENDFADLAGQFEIVNDGQLTDKNQLVLRGVIDIEVFRTITDALGITVMEK